MLPDQRLIGFGNVVARPADPKIFRQLRVILLAALQIGPQGTDQSAGAGAQRHFSFFHIDRHWQAIGYDNQSASFFCRRFTHRRSSSLSSGNLQQFRRKEKMHGEFYIVRQYNNIPN